MRLCHLGLKGLWKSGEAGPMPEALKSKKSLGHADVSGALPLRAASDESRLDPFSAALRSTNGFVGHPQVKKLRDTLWLAASLQDGKLRW